MRANRSMPLCTVIPVLAYADLGEALTWLCEAFGFEVRWRAGGHRAQVWVGDGAIAVVGGVEGSASSLDSIMVRVGDVDAHHARAVEYGARVLGPPGDYPYGERQYTAEDLAGRRWTFSQTIADVAPEEWGGASARL